MEIKSSYGVEIRKVNSYLSVTLRIYRKAVHDLILLILSGTNCPGSAEN